MNDPAGSEFGPGATVSGYRVEALIGRGGMGAVYRASDEGLGRKVALKVIAHELASDERFRERFLRESRIAASLDHPHVVPIYQSGEEGGLLFIAMRYVEGTDLAKLLAAEGVLEPRRALALLSQVAEALDAAHAKGLVHRDVKPSNVLIAEGVGSEHCYLADFGLTRREGSASGISAEGEIVGTLEYVAPEQIMGDAPDTRSDVYSLGCVLYECLTGQAPFPRATDVALLWAHVHEEPPLPSGMRPELPQELDSALARALAKNPEERYRSARELIEACSEPGSGVSPAGATPSTNLPRPLSSFVGRDAELAEVRARIEGGARLLTLTGPGGSGKTRLALEAASSLVPEFEAGVFWVGLSALRDPALVTETIAQTLGAKGGLSQHIGGRELLLLLDNLEQVIEAAPELAAMLASCPNLTLLVTTRELLRVQGEVEYAVPPLVEQEAVELFCQRSGLAPSEEIIELCARLDNLPLALELAAPRAKALSVAQILERLSGRLDLFKGGRDADPRQQTLRAAIEWSYDLLAEGEHRLLRRLSVFAGGCTLEAAEEVCDADLDTLQSLVEKSLLRHSDGRYFMLETIREYALERLEEISEATSVGDRHARYFAGLVDCRWTELVMATEFRGFVASERRNLSAALEWSLERKNGEDALAIVSGVWASWNDSRQGRRLAERALALPTERLSQRRGDVLLALSQFAKFLGDFHAARRALEESLAVYREVDEHSPRVAASFTGLAEVALAQGDLAEARRLAEEGVRIRREQLDSFRLTRALSTLVEIELADGDLGRARELAEETLERCRGDSPEGRQDVMVAQALRALAEVAVRERDFDTARRHLLEAFDVMSEVRPVGEDVVYELLRSAALVAVEQGDVDAVAVLAGAVDERADRSGIGLPTEYDGRMPLLRRYADGFRRLREDAEVARFDPLYARGRLLEPDKAIEYAVRYLN